MNVNGKRDSFALADLDAVGKLALLKRGRAAARLEPALSAARPTSLAAPLIVGDLASLPEPRQLPQHNVLG